MSSVPGIPAKLSRPRLFDIAPRERLFSLVETSRSHPAIWIDGPAGAGKTSLLAGYIEARGLAARWYQVDAGDADLGKSERTTPGSQLLEHGRAVERKRIAHRWSLLRRF